MEFKTIDTEKGLTELKEGGSYSSAKELNKRTEAKAIDKGFEKSRLEIQKNSDNSNIKNQTKKRYIVKEDLDLDTEDLYGISADEIDEFNKGGTK
jgi:hypothetical protein